MSARLANMMRWSRIRGLIEARMQRGRVETFDSSARDDAQRPQDYGFAAQPVEGQGLVLEIGGHSVVIRVDRLAERPELAAYEVCVWHKEGHKFTLKSGGLIQADCSRLVVNAATEVVFNTPTVRVNGDQVVSGTTTTDKAVVETQLVVTDQDYVDHAHDEVERGSDVSGGVV